MKIVHTGPIKKDIYECSCGSCGTVFEFSKEDVDDTHVYNINTDVEIIQCPYCGNYIITKEYQQKLWKEYKNYHSRITSYSVPPKSIIKKINYNESLQKVFIESTLNNMTPNEWISFNKNITSSSESL